MISIVRGRTERIQAQFFSDIDNKIPLVITGASASCLFKCSPRDLDADAKISKSVGSGITLTDPANGIVEIYISSTDTKDLSYSKLFMELVIKISADYYGNGVEEVELSPNVVKTLF